MRRGKSAGVQQATLAIHAVPLPRCSNCGEKTPRHAEHVRAGKTVRVVLCGKCARGDDDGNGNREARGVR